MTSDTRAALAATLREALPNTLVLPHFGPAQANRTIVIRRGPYKPNRIMGELDEPTSWDLVLLVPANRPDSSDLLDELTQEALEVLDVHDDLDGAVDSAAIKEVGEEELIAIDGQLYLSSSVEVEVL